MADVRYAASIAGTSSSATNSANCGFMLYSSIRRLLPELFGSRGSMNTVLKRALDHRLDEALKDTFPASDAVSIVISVRNG